MTNLGIININKSNGFFDNLFGDYSESNNAISMDFSEGKVVDSVGKRFTTNGRTFYRIYMSNEQWSTLLMNKNMNNGVPCTLFYKPTGKTSLHFSRKDRVVEEKTPYQTEISEILKEVEDKINLNIGNINNIYKDFQSFILQDKQGVKERKEYVNKIEDFIKTYSEKRPEIENYLQSVLERIDKLSEQEFQKDIVETTFGLKQIPNSEEILKLFNINSDTKLIEGKKESVTPDYGGLLYIEDIISDNGFVGDRNSLNGIKITLKQATIEYNAQSRDIVPKETLAEFEMSFKQFSDLIISFGESGVEMGINQLNEVNEPIKEIDEAIEKLDIVKMEFDESFDEFEEKARQYSDNLINMLNKKIGKTKQQRAKIDMEMLTYFPHNTIFYIKEIINEYNKLNITKRQDFQVSISKRISELGVESFAQRVNNGDTLDISNIINSHSKIAQIAKKSEQSVEKE